MNVLIDTNKMRFFYKTQYSFRIKTLYNLKIERNFLSLIMDNYKKIQRRYCS